MTRRLSIVTALALAACSDSTGTADNTVRVSFATSASPAASARLSAPTSGFAASLSGTGGGHTLVITRAQLVVSEMELKGASSSECAAGAGAEDDCQELELSPMLLDLPVGPGATAAIVTALPPGTYTGMEMKVDAIWPGEDDGAAFLAAHPGFEAVTVRLEGTFDGEPFVFISNGEAELHLTFASPVTVDANGLNITVNVDPLRWFRNQSGAYVDPRTANEGGANESMVDENIRASFHAFEDSDRDGVED